MKRKIAAILAADVAGYSRLVAEDEERTLTELAASREIFDALIGRVGGRIFNTAGDSVMVEFDSAVEAVRAAVDIQEAMRSRNIGVEPDRRLEFRMGLTIGDVVERDGDLLGDGVNIAARLESLAPAGGICVSRSVHEAVSNKLGVTFRELGPRQVKNIPQPVHAYLITPQGGHDLTAPEPLVARRARSGGARPERRTRRSLRRVSIALSALAIVFVAIPGFRALNRAFDAPVDRPASQPATGGKPPASEPARPAAPDKPIQGEKATEKSPATPAQGPARPKAEKPPQKVAAPAKPEAGKPEPAKQEPAKSEGMRPDAPKAAERPADAAAAFAGLAKEGLLADAKTLPELYHNARFLEAKGDRAGALAAYAAAAPLAGEAIDVHFRHASLLRAMKGPAAVGQAYAALIRSAPSVAAEIVLALSREGDERRASLEAFGKAHPDDAVGDHLLADDLLDMRDGGPTLTERRLAFAATERFLDAAGSGEIDGRFVDRSFLDAWLDAARRRRGDVERFFASARTRPSVTFARIPTGWLGKLNLPESATAIAVRLGERGDPTSTGFAATADAKTGQPVPNTEFQLPAGTGRATLYVTYRDRSGREAGPFPLPFDPGAATVDAGRSALERFPESWVSFREDMPGVLSYSGLVSNRCAIARVLIGIGNDPPRSPLALPPCDATGSATMPSGASLLSLPDGTETVQVQLTYQDGSESQVRSFRRP